MKTTIVSVAGLGLALLAVGCAAADHGDAAAQADRFAQEHSAGWQLRAHEQDATRALQFASFSKRCTTGDSHDKTTLEYVASGYEIAFGFSCLPGRTTELAALKDAFSYVALNQLPHGIKANGWKFVVLTPSSSLAEGVELLELANGRLSVRITTPLYAVYGESLDKQACPHQEDGALPANCFVNRELGFPLALSLSVPFSQEIFAP
jgi:hypothetical protein